MNGRRVYQFIVILFLIFYSASATALDRCIEYTQPVRIQHVKQFGWQFPWWYGIGQLKQESCCRANATAFDQGMGIAQFMPKTAQYINALMRTSLDPYNPESAIRMQAFYMARLHRGNWAGVLWLTYQGYNGGYGALKSEYKKAGLADWKAMKAQCTRKTIKLKSGALLSFCDVNYDYSQRVYRYGRQYASGKDGMRYW